jgi:hypothetical protein
MSKRPSQVHYIPPNRRRSAIESVSDIDRAPAASTTAPPRKAKPAPLLPGPFINTPSPSAQRERSTIVSTTPAASTLLRTRTKQPTTTTQTASPSASALGTTNTATRSRIRDSYASSTQQRIDALQSERSIPAPPSRASAHDRNMRSSHHHGRHDVGHGSHRVEVSLLMLRSFLCCCLVSLLYISYTVVSCLVAACCELFPHLTVSHDSFVRVLLEPQLPTPTHPHIRCIHCG